MNGEGRSKTNLGLNVVTMIALIITLVAGGMIATDLYTTVHKTIAFQEERAELKNKVDNATFIRFNQVLEGMQMLYNSSAEAQQLQYQASLNNSRLINQTLENQKVLEKNQVLITELLKNLTR